MPRMYEVTILVKVISERNLKVGAEIHARERDGLSAAEWAEIRNADGGGPEPDLVTLLDPGTLPGCDIIETSVEATAPSIGVPALMTIRDLCDVTKRSRASIYRDLARDPSAPKPVKIGQRATRFRQADVLAWLAAK